MLKNYVKLIVAILFVSNVMAQNIPSYVPTNGLVGWWPFNGNANDESGNGNNGKVNGATLSADRNGKANSAYYFNNSSYISVKNIPSLNNTTNFSISVWEQINANTLYSQFLISRGWDQKSGHFHISYDIDSVKFNAQINQNWNIGSGQKNITSNKYTIPQANWKNIIATYDGVNFNLYIDGILEKSTKYSNSLATSNDSIFFGKHGIYANYFLKGKLDEIGIWNRALTNTEIKQLYTSSGNNCTTAKPIVSNNQSFCDQATVNDLKASGTDIKWYASATGGSPLSTTTALKNGTVYYASQTLNNCESTTRAVVTATINSTPTLIGLKDTTLCDYGAVKLNVKSSVGSINWYNTITGGTKLSTSESYTTPTLYNTTTFYVEAINGQCTSQRAPIKVNVNNYRIGYSDTVVCIGNTTKLTAISNNTTTTSDYKIGSTGPAGGIVFYDQGSVINGWRYLEAAPSNILTSSWGCGDLNISGATSTAIGSGLSNTNAIVTNCKDTTTAASRCLNYSLNGYDDWFLPSQNEFSEIYKNLISKNLGNFNVTPIPGRGTLYWTSTQLTPASGSHLCLDCNGNFYQYAKVYELYVRPVRSFSTGISTSTYKWSTGETTQSINPIITKPTDFWVDITTNGVTCRKYISIKVNPTLIGDLTMGNNNQTKCVNQPIDNIEYTFNNLYYYSISLGGINQLPTNINTYVKGNKLYINGTPTTSGTYNYSISVKGKCETTDVKGVLVINSLPNASIYSNGPSEVCEGNSVNLIAKGGIYYKWNNGLTTDNINVKESGDYTVNVIDQNGCESTANKTVIINPNPIVTMNDLNPLTLKTNTPIKLYGKPTGGTFVGQGVNGAEFNPSYTTLGKKIISYNYTTPQGCSGSTSKSTIVVDSINSTCSTYDTLKIKVQLTTGIKAGQQTSMNVYPNPTSDILIIEANDIQSLSGYKYKIVDLQGKEVYNALATTAKTEISLKSIGAKGMYILHIVDEKGISIENKKIVLE